MNRAVWTIRLTVDHAGRIVEVDPAAKNLLGHDDVIGRYLDEFILLDLDTPSTQRIASYGTKHPPRDMYGLVGHYLATTLRGADGSLIPARVRITRSADQFACAIVAHPGKRLSVIPRYRETKRVQRTFDLLPIGLAHIAVDGRFLAVNTRLCDILGSNREALLQRHFHTSTEADGAYPELSYRRRLFDVDRTLAQMLLSGQHAVRTVHYQRPDSSAVWLRLTVSFVSDQGSPYFIWIVEDISDRKKMERSLDEVKESERRRIARDMHDLVLHHLVDALIELRDMQERLQNETLHAQLMRPILSLESTFQNLRASIYNLRHGETKEQSFIELVTFLVHIHRQLSPACDTILEIQDCFPNEMPLEIQVELSHIMHEALFNIRRHAHAQHTVLTLGCDGQDLWIDIVDDGCGFDPSTPTGGIGLTGMRERAHLIGSQIAIESAAGKGTRVRVSVPHGAIAGQ